MAAYLEDESNFDLRPVNVVDTDPDAVVETWERIGAALSARVNGSCRAVVESPAGAFPALEIHYAETFIVPAAVGGYRVRPDAPQRGDMATIKAFIRT